MRRRELAIMMAVLLAVSASGCGGKTNTKETTQAPTTEATTEAPTTGEPTTEEGPQFSEDGAKAAAFFEGMYERLKDVELPPFIESHELDLTDTDMLKYQTGLDSADGISSVVMSESMLTASAYALIYIIPEEGTDSEELLETVLKSVDPAKWICVVADYVYGVTFGDDVFVIMTSDRLGDTVYDAAVAEAEAQEMKVGKKQAAPAGAGNSGRIGIPVDAADDGEQETTEE